MKHMLKRFVGLVLSACLTLGSLPVYTNLGTVSVYAEDGLALSCSSGSTSAQNLALSGTTHEVRFIAPGYATISDVMAAGYTTLSISYEVSSYTSSGDSGVQPFVTFNKTWASGGVWNDLKSGSTSGTVTLDITQYGSDATNNVYFGLQFTNVTGSISYNITSAKLLGGSGSGGGSQIGDSTEDLNDEVELNYAKLLQESLYFYDANMCGSDVDENSLFSWRSDCHTYDAAATYNGKTIDLSGGYHDAGDHAKFGLPAAFAASTLGVSYMEYKDVYEELGLTAHYKRIMDRFAEYFEKCTVMNNGKVEAFCYQVGNGTADHSYMGIPENQTTERTAYFTSASNPCTDTTCETAAALALYYINFGDTKALTYAKALFEYADTNAKGNSVSDPSDLYTSTSYWDDYAFAAAMLYKATGDSTYKTKYNSCDSSGKDCYWVLTWDCVSSLANIYAPGGGFSNNTVTNYVTGTAASSAKSDGYVNISKWGSARYNAGLQFMGLIADKKQAQNRYFTWAQGQMSYLLGNNSAKKCFVVGYNQFSVKNPHHRAVYGIDNMENGNNNAKHLLLGALVGGPEDTAATFNDSVLNYTETEVALDYNACLTAAAAALYERTMSIGTDEEKALQTTIDVSAVTSELRNLTTTLKGDVNNDGFVNTKDTALVLKHLTAAKLLDDTTNADMNNDKKIDMRDVILIASAK